MSKYIKLGVGTLAALLLGIFAFMHFRTANPKSMGVEKPLYLAFGDSIAAGQGLETESDSSACNRTTESYPNYVSANLDYKLVSVACSGATIAQGLLGPQNVNGAELEPQLTKLDGTKPRLISVTIGANDVGWSQIITKCLLSDCGSATDTSQVLQKKQELASSLQNVLTEIQNKTGGNTTTILTGYYQVYPATQQQCSSPSGLTSGEQVWLHSQIDILNHTIQTSTKGFAFSRYAPVDFQGHELCTETPWIQNLNNSAPFHPTNEGQSAIGRAVISATHANLN